MKNIGWGIIGCGDVCEVKSGPAFQKANGSSLVAVMRRNFELAKDFAKRHGVERYYSNAEDLIHDPAVTAVYVATPPCHHKEFVLMAAQAKKAVYVEKPMAMNYKECNEMIEACKTGGVPLWVAYYRRALPRFLKIKEWLDQKIIGEVLMASICLHQKVQDTILQVV